MAAEEHVENKNSENVVKKKYEKSVLDNFNKLTHNQEKVRIKNSVNLLKYLSDTECEKNSEIAYALGRLVRGLGASKNQTRIGYFTCLVGLLQLNSFSIDDIFKLIEKELHKGGGNTKSENADVCCGQILVAGAILRTDLYDNASTDDKKRILETLLNASKQRNYLHLAAFSFIVDLYNKIDNNEFNTIVFPFLKDDLSKKWDEQDLDTLYLLIETQKSFPKATTSKFLQKNLGSNQIITSASLHPLCETLTTILRATAINHPVYTEITNILVGTKFIVPFFENLDQFLVRSNRNKFFVIIKLLTHVLPILPDSNQIADLFGKNFIQQMLHTFKTCVGKLKDKLFQDIIKALFDEVLTALKREDVQSETKIKLLKKFLFWPGSFIFEKITKTKLVQHIIQTLSTDGVKQLAIIYKEVISAKNERVVSETGSEKWWNIDRIYASHLLIKLLNHHVMNDENEWKIEQLVFLMQMGLFQKAELGNELADAFKESFFSSLDLKLSKLEDLRLILFKIVAKIDEEQNADLLTVEELEIWQKTYEIVKKLQKKPQVDKKLLVFQVLFQHLALQLFHNSKLACESLEELFACYKRIDIKKKTNADDPEWIEVMIELFLNLLSHNSALLRNIISCVFTHLCQFIDLSGLQQILSVLDPNADENPLEKYGAEDELESSDGEQEEDEDSDEESEDEEQEETVSDKLKIALQQALSTETDDVDSIDLDELDTEKGEALDKALGQAFKQFKPNLGKSKKQNKSDQQLTHFRIRVLDLIEIYINTNNSMQLHLEVMLPLLQVLEFSVRDDHQRPLEHRVRACLKKLTTWKAFDCSDISDELLIDLLKSLLEKGTKNAILLSNIGEKLSDCCIFLVKCVEAVNGKKKRKVWKVLRDSLVEFFSKRDSLIPFILFKSVLQLNSVGIVELHATLIGFIFTDAVRPFRRYQAMDLLKTFYLNHRVLNEHRDRIAEKIGASQERFLSDSLAFFVDFNADPSGTAKKFKAKFLTQLFELLAAMRSTSESFGGWTQIGEMIRELRAALTIHQDTKVAFRKLCSVLGVSNVVEMRSETVRMGGREAEVEGRAVDVEAVVNGKGRKHRKMGKEALKLKKETKELRMSSLSDGFSKKRKMVVLEGEEPMKKEKRR